MLYSFYYTYVINLHRLPLIMAVIVWGYSNLILFYYINVTIVLSVFIFNSLPKCLPASWKTCLSKSALAQYHGNISSTSMSREGPSKFTDPLNLFKTESIRCTFLNVKRKTNVGRKGFNNEKGMIVSYTKTLKSVWALKGKILSSSLWICEPIADTFYVI